ncbi:hypothetical protein L226DRAFT_234423 [Lentinus tigrinus ALCF2SS1-7]|uniref:uncharacterized protein n=1 Tax=Lentinus tigrinus ALCF2SS1-7 TaxID=1328758 RepID=UPI0011660451|nr:hypothetical protein L226DRAFT_234423 [Lentinus tigrinus ALCF2SS1-7]
MAHSCRTRFTGLGRHADRTAICHSDRDRHRGTTHRARRCLLSSPPPANSTAQSLNPQALGNNSQCYTFSGHPQRRSQFRTGLAVVRPRNLPSISPMFMSTTLVAPESTLNPHRGEPRLSHTHERRASCGRASPLRSLTHTAAPIDFLPLSPVSRSQSCSPAASRVQGAPRWHHYAATP